MVGMETEQHIEQRPSAQSDADGEVPAEDAMAQMLRVVKAHMVEKALTSAGTDYRSGISDWEWDKTQPVCKPMHNVGDIVALRAGGYCMIREVSVGHSGRHAKYAVCEVEGLPFSGRSAWYNELDFRNVLLEAGERGDL
jgi:hypothetical protein